jgi:hypothetical protein
MRGTIIMSNKQKKIQSNYENIKSCLSELGFTEPHESIGRDSGKIITGIQDGDFEMFIEITYQADIANIKVSPGLVFEVGNKVPFYQLLNEINLRLMDIGHFAISEADGNVLLQTSIDLSGQGFDRDQMLATIQRISIHGLELFKLLREMFDGDQCPFHLLHKYIEEMRNNNESHEKTIH